jgi:hypothetical protein
MLIKRFFIVLVMILASAGWLRAQEPATDAGRLQGEWQLENVKSALYAQEGNKLIEERVWVADSTRALNVFVPLVIRMTNGEYTIEHKAGMEEGTFTVPVNGMLGFVTKNEPAIIYGYQLPQSTTLEVKMPAAFYKDNTRRQAVKLVYTCYYRKKQ